MDLSNNISLTFLAVLVHICYSNFFFRDSYMEKHLYSQLGRYDVLGG